MNDRGDIAELRARLRFLARTPVEHELLDEVLAHVDGVEHDGDDIVVHLRGGRDPWLILAPAADVRSVPEPLATLLRHTGGMANGELGTMRALELHDGFDGTLATVGSDTGLDEDAFGPCSGVCAPIDLGLSRFYFLDPATDALYLFDHDGGAERVQPAETLASVYLRQLLKRIS
jgi:hypothetical protein